MARYAGLTGAPDESGAKRREQGLAKAGNARVRRGMIQLATNNSLTGKAPYKVRIQLFASISTGSGRKRAVLCLLTKM